MRIVDESLLQYFRNRPCELCGRPAPSDPHHVEAKGMDAGKQLDTALNLMSLCRVCHFNVQEVAGMKKYCLERVAQREGLESGDVVQEALWRLLRRPK